MGISGKQLTALNKGVKKKVGGLLVRKKGMLMKQPNKWCRLLDRDGFMIGFYIDVVDVNNHELEELPYAYKNKRTYAEMYPKRDSNGFSTKEDL